VALTPGADRSQLPPAGIFPVTSSPPCTDPALSADLVLPGSGLCSHGGAVMHANETFAVTWDPTRSYWQTTRNYVEQFLRDVADGSGTLSSPYAVTSQYTDASGRAKNSSRYGGGCIDYGLTGGSACRFGSTNGGGAGNNYPVSACPVTGSNQFHEFPGGGFGSAPNDRCLTDAQLQSEVASMIRQYGLNGRTSPGYKPLIVLLTPPGVVTCLDSGGALCSANSSSAQKFCSYHSQVNVDGALYAYVVQPWTALTPCDEPDAPAIPSSPPADVFAKYVGIRLVSPLSQSQIASIVNPSLDGWFALDGSEINDNGCTLLGNGLDSATVGGSGQNPYLLQREFNNAGVIESDPNAPDCAPLVNLGPTFVVPSAVNSGDVVQFDGSTTVSSLIVPRANYVWTFGDGGGAVGPSVVHSYAKGGTYTVKLTVIDRGANVAGLSQQITVLGPSGVPVTPPPPTHTGSRLSVHIQLLPQSLRSMLRSGVAVRVSSNQGADGIATLSISRSAAKAAHIRTGRGPSVVIGRGTLSGIKNGSVKLHLHLPRATVAKLQHLRHVTLTIRLAVVSAARARLAVVVAGRY
ncbi:MAG: PKD domain-containing protein, partial [Solirubrobacteraceae bacterium]